MSQKIVEESRNLRTKNPQDSQTTTSSKQEPEFTIKHIIIFGERYVEQERPIEEVRGKIFKAIVVVLSIISTLIGLLLDFFY